MKNSTEIYSMQSEEGEAELVALRTKVAYLEEIRIEQQKKLDELSKWAHIFEHAGWGIVVGSADATTLEIMNPTFAHMHGYEVGELEGTPIFEIFAPESRPTLLGNIQQAHQRGQHSFEAMHLRKDGTKFPVLVDVTAVKNPNGEILYRAVAVQDISERKQAEEERLRLLALEQEARKAAEESERRLAFLAEASKVLTASLDYESTLKAVARLAIPELADWCAVVIIEEDGTLNQLEGIYLDQNKAGLAHQIQQYQLSNLEAPHGLGQVLRTGQAEFITKMDETLWQNSARDTAHLQLLSGLDLKSFMIVPLQARGKTLGALTFASSRPGRYYTQNDLALAEEVAGRAALALDNARLYREAQVAIDSRDKTLDLLNTLLAAAPIGLAFLDRELRYLRINATLAAINGLPIQEHLGHTLREILPQMALTVEPTLQSVMEQGEAIVDLEVSGYAPSRPDELHHWLATYYPVREGAGPIQGVGIVVVDITGRKLAEKQLLEERERLAVTLRSIEDGVITTDTTGKISLVNRAAGKLTGWDLAEALGQPLTEVFVAVHPKTRERCPDLVAQVLGGGQIAEWAQTSRLIARNDPPNGPTRLIEASAVPLYNPKSQISGVVLTFHDVTEKQKLTDELLKASKLESVGLLAGGIAHDFNNILAMILGNLSLLKLSLQQAVPTQDENLGYICEAEKATDRAKELTQQLLTFAKGGAPIKKAARLPELIQDSAQFVLLGTNVKCELTLSPEVWLVEVDQGQFSQVIQNLVINATQAMPKGGKLRILTENVVLAEGEVPPLPAGKYVQLRVEDQGTGIRPEDLPRIFDPYFTTKEQGNGLGLSICYSIIHKHGGHITVDSQPERGSTFQIYLPASTKEVIRKEKKQLELKTGQGRVLMMDDEPTIRKLVSTLLSKLGYEVESVPDGRETIRRYREALTSGQPFEVVIMDLTVPGGMGGEEAIGYLLQLDPNVKAIASSGYSTDPVMAYYHKYGFKGVIPKPYSLESLSKVVSEVLQASPSQGAKTPSS